IHSFLICNPAIISYYNTLGSWKVTFLIPIGKMVLNRCDNKWWDGLALRIHPLDDRSPLLITRLGLFSLTTAI
ncbi:hypothetical protein B0T14DRAFT_588447, partial [Immersiella caudata]